MRFPITLCFEEQVEALERLEDNTLAIRTNKPRHHTRALIITVGIGAFAPTKLKAERADEFEGRGLDYYVRDTNDYQMKRGLVVDGGERAVGWASEIVRVASRVFLIHHKDHFKEVRQSSDKRHSELESRFASVPRCAQFMAR